MKIDSELLKEWIEKEMIPLEDEEIKLNKSEELTYYAKGKKKAFERVLNQIRSGKWEKEI